MVKVFYSRIPETLDETVVPSLSEYRQNSLKTKTNHIIRKQGIASELLLEKAVEKYYSRPLPIRCSEKGKPSFEDNRIKFNLSHSGKWIACAVSDQELGLDIQTIEKYNSALAKRFFREDEIEYILCSAEQDKAFTEVWCKKESRLKATGYGLSGGLNSFSVFEKPDEYAFGMIEDFCFSICVPGFHDWKVEYRNIKLL